MNDNLFGIFLPNLHCASMSPCRNVQSPECRSYQGAAAGGHDNTTQIQNAELENTESAAAGGRALDLRCSG